MPVCSNPLHPLFYFFLPFRATTVAHGSSQARGLIRAAAASLHHSHSNAGSKLRLRPTPQLTATHSAWLGLKPASSWLSGSLTAEPQRERPTHSFFLFLFFCFRTESAAYGSSQARGRIGAAAAGLCNSHSNASMSHVCNLYHSSWQRRTLNPPSRARDWTCFPVDTSQVLNLLSHNRNSASHLLDNCQLLQNLTDALEKLSPRPSPWRLISASPNLD